MPFSEVAVIRADAYANRAIGVLASPEFEAFLRTGRPLQDTFQIRYAMRLPRRRASRNRFGRAGAATSLAYVAEFFYAESFRFVQNQRHVSEYLAKS